MATHVAVCLGRGRVVVEAVQPRVRVAGYASTRGRTTVLPYVVRSLADR
ncbi:MAG TPA: hypothetical protein VES01_03825 [Dermatophilaceae bacterium]|nr:hypothetical protein [Dermatophilaceae bacterium]